SPLSHSRKPVRLHTKASSNGTLLQSGNLLGLLQLGYFAYRSLVLLSFPAMQRWIVKHFLQARSLQRAGLDIAMPIFRQDQRLIQIVICDAQRRAVKCKVSVPVVANVNSLLAGIAGVVPSGPHPIRNVRSRPARDGHAAVAHASPV